MTDSIQFSYEDDEGLETTVTLPSRWEICDTCIGEGKHSRGVEGDGGGITSSEWAEWDAEERDTYVSGGYDRRCDDCQGSGKIKVVDEDQLTPDLRKRWHEKLQGDSEWRRSCRMGY